MLRFFAAALVAAAAVAASALDCTVTLHPMADTRILSLFPTSNFGLDILATYNAAGNEQRSLLQFDLAQVPAHATIHSAVLRLYGIPFAGSTTATSISAYRVARDWQELQATWMVAVTGQAWVHPGGDLLGSDGAYLGSPYGTWSGDQSPTYRWYEVDVTTLVNEQVQGLQPNHGIAVASPLGCQLVYIQRENPAPPHNPPELVIAYSADIVPGDLNCDCHIDFGDINPFVLALSDPAAYAQQYPGCNILDGDINGDGHVDFGDISPFVTLLIGG